MPLCNVLLATSAQCFVLPWFSQSDYCNVIIPVVSLEVVVKHNKQLDCTVHNPVTAANHSMPSHALHVIFDVSNCNGSFSISIGVSRGNFSQLGCFHKPN